MQAAQPTATALAAPAAPPQLETENSKLKYQCLHLKRAVVEGDEKLAALQAK